ncbi:hypothetical protein BJ741DRAFT_282081 [Chytriomyces cf. hyalinus JEL632]|nr:hypothetical protein BJ741DRAFT_282081 [Chytriomyces cf. hyalinus JEL632]
MQAPGDPYPLHSNLSSINFTHRSRLNIQYASTASLFQSKVHEGTPLLQTSLGPRNGLSQANKYKYGSVGVFAPPLLDPKRAMSMDRRADSGVVFDATKFRVRRDLSLKRQSDESESDQALESAFSEMKIDSEMDRQTQDLTDFVACIKHLVTVPEGSVFISDVHMGLIRSSVFKVYDSVFKKGASSATTASDHCIASLPELMSSLTFINNNANRDSSDDNAFSHTQNIDTTSANESIRKALERAKQILGVDENECVGLVHDRVEFYWVRERLCSVFCCLVGGKTVEARQELASLFTQAQKAEKRDSNQTLVDTEASRPFLDEWDGYEEKEQLDGKQAAVSQVPVSQVQEESVMSPVVSLLELPSPIIEPAYEAYTPTDDGEPTSSTFLVYTGELNAFSPVERSISSSNNKNGGNEESPTITFAEFMKKNPVTRKQVQHLRAELPTIQTKNLIPAFRCRMNLKSAIARIDSDTLSPGDTLIIMSGWKGDTVPTPTATFLPPPPALDEPAIIVGTQRKTPLKQGFETVSLARLESSEFLFPGYSRLTVCVQEELATVPFDLSANQSGHIGNPGFDEDMFEVRNRVQDALKFGAVRVGCGVKEAFFS